MKHKLYRISMVLGVSGMLAIGLASGASAATTAGVKPAAVSPTWHTVLSVPAGTGSSNFSTVIATGRTTGWVFLDNSAAAYERTGATWKEVAFPGSGGLVDAAGASSPSNVWAAYNYSGSGSGSELYRWNGREWAAVKSFSQGSVNAISVLGPNNVWVFGGASRAAGVFHFDGRTWTEVSATLQGGSALSDNNVWGLNGTDVEHYNGRVWKATDLVSLLPAQLSGHPAPSVTNIFALAPNDVYATGEGYQTPRGGPGVLLHFDGRTWTKVAEGGSFLGFVNAFASDGTGGLWIAAKNFPSYYPGLFHYSAGQLTAVNLGATSLSVSRIPGTTEALSVGWQVVNGTGFEVLQQYS